MVTLTHNYKQTIRERAKRDPNFSTALMNEAVSSLLDNEPETARLIIQILELPGRPT